MKTSNLVIHTMQPRIERSSIPSIAHDIWIRGIAPYAADDDAKTLRSLSRAMHDDIDETFVYRDRRYQITRRRGAGSRNRHALPRVSVRHAVVLHEDEIQYISHATLETLVVYEASQRALEHWFAGDMTWRALHTLDIRYEFRTPDVSGNVVLKRTSLPKLNTLCMTSTPFNIGFSECGDCKSLHDLQPLRVRIDNTDRLVHTGIIDNIGVLFIRRYDTYPLVTPPEIDTVYIYETRRCYMRYVEYAPTRVRHLVLKKWFGAHVDSVDSNSVRELTVFSSRAQRYNDDIYYVPISLERYPNVERVNIAFPARVTDTPVNCVVRRMTLDEARAVRKRLTVECLD